MKVSVKSMCDFCQKMRVITKYDDLNNISEKEMIKAKIDPYLYELKFIYNICRVCRKKKIQKMM